MGDVGDGAASDRPAPSVLPTTLEAERFVVDELPRLVKSLTIHTGDRGVGEELAQEALARALADWSKVSAMEDPVAWVHRVGLNLAASRWRRLAARRRAESRLRVPPSPPPPLAAETVALRDAIAGLSRRQREVVVLRFYCGFDVAQTAEVLGLAASTVTTLTARSLARLRVEFDDADR